MSKNFIYQHILNIKKQLTPIILNQDNIFFSNVTVIIKEISRIKEAQQTALKIEEDKTAQEKKLVVLEKTKNLKLKQLKSEEKVVQKEKIKQQQLETQKLAMFEQQKLIRETEERLELATQKLLKKQTEIQPDIVLTTQEIYQDIQKPLESVVIAHIELDSLHPIAEHEPILPLAIIEEPQNVQYIEEHHQEPGIQEIQQQLEPPTQFLITEAQEKSEENDSKDLGYVSDFSNFSEIEEGEYIMVGLAGEHQEL